MSARRDVSATAHVAMHESMQPMERGEAHAVLADLIAAVAVQEAFSDDNDTATAATRTFDELRAKFSSAKGLHAAIDAARACAGQCAARATHGRGRR